MRERDILFTEGCANSWRIFNEDRKLATLCWSGSFLHKTRFIYQRLRRVRRKRIKERRDRVKREVLLGVIEDFALTTL
jgi:hypothetical protein